MQRHVVLLIMLFVSTTGIQRLTGQANVSVAGTVLDAHGGHPIANASVVLAEITGDVNKFSTSHTDRTGNFVIKNIGTGEYRLLVRRDGYIPTEYRRTGIVGQGITTLTIRPGANFTDLIIPMTPTSTVIGQVIDESGDPVPDSYVQVLRSKFDSGMRTLAPIKQARTDDFGRYRIFGLSPGHYYVALVPSESPRIENGQYIITRPPTSEGQPKSWIATSASAAQNAGQISAAALQTRVDIPVFYPGVTEENDAIPVQLRAGEVLDLGTLATRRSSVIRLKGRILNGSTGTIMAGASISVEPVPLVGGTPPVRSLLRSQGAFEFVGLMPGSYILQAATRDNWSAVVPVKIYDKDLSVDVVLQPRFTLSGRVTIVETASSKSSVEFSKLSVRLRSPLIPCGTGCSSSVDAKGSFSINNLTAGQYRVELIGSDRLYAKSVVLGGVEAALSELTIDGAGSFLEIGVSQAASHIEGQVVGGAQGATVVLAPVDREGRTDYALYRREVSLEDGKFSMTGIAPGKYILFACEELDADSWQDPKVVQAFESRALTIELRGSETSQVAVPLIR